MYREKLDDEPITAGEIMALWWRKRAVDRSGAARSATSRAAKPFPWENA